VRIIRVKGEATTSLMQGAKRITRSSPILCFKSLISHVWSILSKKLRMSASSIQFTPGLHDPDR